MNRLTRIGIGVAGSIVLFVAGLLIGREFPMHHYERFGQSPYLYDTSTGKICTPFKKPDTNLLDESMKTPSNPFGFVPLDSNSAPYPPCGK
jgi:hypothetical protein